MKVRRYISFYDKDKDKGNLIKEVEIKMSLDHLKTILNTEDEDINVYKIYSINKAQFQKFSQVIPELSELDFIQFDLFYECFQE